jgi:hypothetical protein
MAADYFALLALPRRPWLEEEQVRENFQRLAASAHPDGSGGDNARFVALNEAWQTLRSPMSRLRHYLELTAPELLPHPGSQPAANADLFMEIAEAQQCAGAVAGRLAAAKSPLARALLEPEKAAARERLESLAAQVARETAVIHEVLREGAAPPAALATALGQLVFFEKWSAQLRERLLALA